ncbi:hypothetical protein GCM10009867_20190 [Pedococcus aerophilus]|uniref:DUF5666 domain-containing protein n=1 Tax=Pedococcus aerophilus TaxID=436356 RepID=A0ABN3UNI7_9MICO
MRPLRPVLALSAVALVAACGTGTDGGGTSTGGATAGATTGATTGATPGASATPPATTGTGDPADPTLPSDGRGKLVTVTGTVTDGVENGCLMLTTDPASPDGPWQLIGNTAGIKAGQKVTVRGARVDTVATTCQQGLPFDVQAVVKS